MAISDYWQRVVNRRAHYRHVFLGTAKSGEIVLADLRRFCKADEPTIMIGANGQTDLYATGMLAGRQEVFWRIASHLHLDDAKIIALKESITDL